MVWSSLEWLIRGSCPCGIKPTTIKLEWLSKSKGCIWLYNLLTVCMPDEDYSRMFFLFSSVRSHDFDGLIGIELPVSMYTTKTPIDMCRFNVRSSTLKNLNIFCKRQISIKLFYLYQKLQCRDKYFFIIKFAFFLYLRLSASSKAFMYIFLISDR